MRQSVAPAEPRPGSPGAAPRRITRREPRPPGPVQAHASSSTRLITTHEVLTEFLNALAATGPAGGAHAAATVRDIRNNPQADVLPHSRADFDAALAPYESRPDKGYSLTNCRSMIAMRALGVTEALTNDHTFAQEGSTILFP